MNGRSIGAVAAGAVLVVGLSVGTDTLMEAVGIFPKRGEPPMSDTLFGVATFYRSVFGIAGSFLAARLAPRNPMQHAMILGYIGLAMSTLGLVATWNAIPSLGPRWYPIALVVLAIPGAWLGGLLDRSTR